MFGPHILGGSSQDPHPDDRFVEVMQRFSDENAPRLDDARRAGRELEVTPTSNPGGNDGELLRVGHCDDGALQVIIKFNLLGMRA